MVSKPTKRPTKRKIEPVTDKVMRTGAPREAVKRIVRDDLPGAEAVTETSDTEADEGTVTGTRARRAAQADKVATAKRGRRSRRTTPKSTGAAASGRYTPPSPNYSEMPSPMWVPILMFTLFALGMLTIFLNYVGLVPGEVSNNWYLLLGLGFILGGIITATQYR